MKALRLFYVLGLSVTGGCPLAGANEPATDAAPEIPKPLAHWAFEEEEGDEARDEAGGYHVVYVVDTEAHECRLYLDGDLKKTIAFQGTPRLMQPGQTMRLGASSPTEFMDGVIDEVRIWGVALAPEQVSALQSARPAPVK